MVPATPSPASDPRSDEMLVAALNDGDASAFDALYARHRDWIVRLAWRFTGNRDDALDVLQETWRYVLGKVPRLRLSARMTTFLYPAVKNLSLAIRRKRHGGRLDDDQLARLPAPSPSEAGSHRAELGAVLAMLPESQREVVLMRFVDDMSLAEIAQTLAVPVGTVKSRLHNALTALRGDPRTRRYFEVASHE